MTFDRSILEPADHLIYSGFSPFDLLIEVKTAALAAHIEIYIGDGQSVASRNGIGVNQYPLRTKGLQYVLRPRFMLNLPKAMEWFETVKGTPYGWWDLLNFVDPFDYITSNGMICSQFAAEFDRNADMQWFADEWPTGKVSPRDFLVTNAYRMVWSRYPKTGSDFTK